MGFLGLALAASGCATQPKKTTATPRPEATAPAAAASGPPAWLPAYTPAQRALLKPVDREIQTPAARVFPDLSRFWYANNRRLQDPADAVRFTRMVLTVLEESPRYYAVDKASPELANTIAQYGPPASTEPDGFKIVRRSSNDVGELVTAEITAEAKTNASRGAELAKKGDFKGAADAYRAALSKSPSVPALRVDLADALAADDKADDAALAYQEAISTDPTFAPSYLGLAELAEKRGDVQAARKHLAEALAYHPNSNRGKALTERLAEKGHRVTPFAIFLDVDPAGAIHIATQDTSAAQFYGGCRAVMRYEPNVRSQIFEQPPDTPYYLSVVEEVVCHEAALGAYMADRAKNPERDPDPNLDELLAMAREQGLSGYVMFEILGQHRPERARAAPPDVHRDMVRYIEERVLGQKPLPDSVYTVRRDMPSPNRSL